MSNIYRFAYPTVPHYQMPCAMTGYLKSLNLEQFRFIHLLHSEAQRTNRSEIRMTPTFIKDRTGIHNTNLGKVRTGLCELGLLLFEKVGTDYIYSVCHPETRLPVTDQTMLQKIDLKLVSASDRIKYIFGIIPDGHHGERGVTGRCPLPKHKDDTASFTMYPETGAWRCRGCDQSGSLLSLEILMSENATGATLDEQEAYKLVSNKLRRVGAGSRTTGTLRASADIVFAYTDDDYDVLYEFVRVKGLKSKTRVRRDDPDRPGRYIYNADGCRRVLYRLPEVLVASTVIVVEGEPDVETLRRLLLKDCDGDSVAVTTNPYGALNWLPEYTHTLAFKRVILLGDNDDKGRAHVEQVKDSLATAAIEFKHVTLPLEFKDVTEYLSVFDPGCLTELIGEDWVTLVDKTYSLV